MDKVGIVVLNWNRHTDTIECLRSVGKLKRIGFTYEVYIVDNGSDINSYDAISKHIENHENYKLIRNDANLGFSAGNNIGIKTALADNCNFVLLLNNDTSVDSMLLKNLIGVIKKHTKVGMVSPKIYFTRGYEFHKKRYKKHELGKVIWYAGGLVDWKNMYGSNRGVDEVDRGQYDDEIETVFATGACVLMNKSAIEDTGNFNEKYFMYMEDLDLSIRMRKRGWSIRYCPKAVIWHKVAQSSGIGSDLNDYFITRNRLLFGLTYSTWRTRFALYLESLKFLKYGRPWQQKGVFDFYTAKLGKGSWK